MDQDTWIDRAGLQIEHRGEVFTVELPVRWGDLDAQGHVNNGVVFDYLQDARVDFLLAGGVPTMLDQGVLAVEHTIEYRAPITFSCEPVQVHIVMVERRLARFRVGYLVVHGDQLCAVASSIMVPFDLATQRPRRLSSEEAAWFDRYRWQIANPFRHLPTPTLRGRGHRHALLTRWSDVDRFNHVNNVRMLDYFQDARIALTTADDPSAARAGMGAGAEGLAQWLIARQDIEYLAQLGFRRTPYEVTTAVTRIGTSSLTLAAELVEPESGKVFSRSRQVLVRADDRGRPQPLPGHTRAALGRFLVTDEGADRPGSHP